MAREVVDAPPGPGLAAGAIASLARIRREAPRVHCLTNTVAQSLTANLLSAAGAIPSMSLAVDEIDHFIAGSAALLVNLGTLDEARRAAMTRAVAVAGEQGKPWVLDPVMVDRSPRRLEFARALLAHRPTVVRGNVAEMAVLAGRAGPGGLARAAGAVVAETGRVDRVSDGRHVIRITTGHPLMARVIGLGCAASALVAAFCAIEGDRLMATAQALFALGVAGELAGETAVGPASFQTALLDRLYVLDADTLAARGRIA